MDPFVNEVPLIVTCVQCANFGVEGGSIWRCLPPVSREPRSCSAANNSSYLDETMMLEFPMLPCDLVRGVDWSIIICSVSKNGNIIDVE